MRNGHPGHSEKVRPLHERSLRTSANLTEVIVGKKRGAGICASFFDLQDQSAEFSLIHPTASR